MGLSPLFFSFTFVFYHLLFVRLAVFVSIVFRSILRWVSCWDATIAPYHDRQVRDIINSHFKKKNVIRIYNPKKWRNILPALFEETKYCLVPFSSKTIKQHLYNTISILTIKIHDLIFISYTVYVCQLSNEMAFRLKPHLFHADQI